MPNIQGLPMAIVGTGTFVPPPLQCGDECRYDPDDELVVVHSDDCERCE